MKILINDLNEFYTDRVRLVKRLLKRESLQEYPELLKWALLMLYFNGEKWIEICRIDNYIHQNQQGSHMHIEKDVKRMELSFEGAEQVIKQISARILREKFQYIINFGDE